MDLRETAESRGLRNNNPGNIEKGEKWKGQAPSRDKRFVTFESLEYGFRAMGRIFLSYHHRHDITTITQALHRWAPPKENDTKRYIEYVAREAGVGPRATCDITDYQVALPLARAIMEFENSGDDENHVPDSVISRGLAMAGIRPDARSPDRPFASRTVSSSAGAATSTAVAGVATLLPVVSEAGSAVSVWGLGPYLPYIALVGFGLAVALNFRSIKSRVEDMIYGRN